MGLFTTLLGPLQNLAEGLAAWQLALFAVTAFLVLAIVLNVLSQLLLKNPNEPPLVFHWVPIIGSTISYGIDPFTFFFACREKVGAHRCLLIATL